MHSTAIRVAAVLAARRLSRWFLRLTWIDAGVKAMVPSGVSCHGSLGPWLSNC